MARRNPQDTIAALRDDNTAKDTRIDELEDEVDRLRGRMSRVAALTTDVLDDVDEEDEEEDQEDDEDEEDE
jgi:Ran GTPase-activating protein (RanGAP) involved in mRNA processing and transport